MTKDEVDEYCLGDICLFPGNMRMRITAINDYGTGDWIITAERINNPIDYDIKSIGIRDGWSIELISRPERHIKPE